MALASSSIASPATWAGPRRATELERLESATVVYLAGELDLSTLDEEDRTMARAIALDAPLVVDLSGVEFMGATTVRVLVRAAEHVQARARSFAIRKPSPVAARVLAICGLDNLVADESSHLVVVASEAR